MNKNKIKLIIANDYNQMSQKAADIIIEQIKKKPNSVLGLATGSTPLGLYERLIKAYKKGAVDFSKIITCNLDEYYPIPQNHDQSYWYFMHTNLFHHLNIPEHQKNLLNGLADDIQKECDEYEKKIREIGGIDLQILGIGNNGHIGFNEPGSSFKSRTRLVNLDEDTIEANSRFFKSKEEVPRQALTMGLATIMEAKKIILLASGLKKTEAVKKALLESSSEEAPASILQKHSDCTFILDDDTASLFKSLI